MDKGTTDWLALAVAGASLIITTALAVIAYRGGQRLAAAEADRNGREGWNKLNELALIDDENLRVADQLLSHESRPGDSMDEIRRRWLGYVLINALADTYVNATSGRTLSKDFQLAHVEHQLSELMRYDDIFRMTQQGYEEPFAGKCRDVRSSLEAAGLTEDVVT